jgi:hypothetical protein
MRDRLCGGGPSPDTRDLWSRWGLLVQLFFWAINRENGTLQHLPYNVSLFDQPYKTMLAFDLLQGMFIDHANEMAKKR